LQQAKGAVRRWYFIGFFSSPLAFPFFRRCGKEEPEKLYFPSAAAAAVDFPLSKC